MRGTDKKLVLHVDNLAAKDNLNFIIDSAELRHLQPDACADVWDEIRSELKHWDTTRINATWINGHAEKRIIFKNGDQNLAEGRARLRQLLALRLGQPNS